MLFLAFLVLLVGFPGEAYSAGTRIVVFPLQELGTSRNGVDLQMTRDLAALLAESGNEVVEMDSVFSFMAVNRIRSAGYLDTINVSRLRRDLGAAFILFGTVCEQKGNPEPRLALVLSLVRTSDVKTVWTFVAGKSQSDERNLLAIAEPNSVSELTDLLLREALRRWPWQMISEEPLVGALNLDTVMLRPQYVRPGGEVSCRVRLENTWGSGQPPRVFFKVAEQIYPATAADDGVTFEGHWVAGEENGRVPVRLVLDWPIYARTESALLGNFLIDGTLPLLKFELLGAREMDGRLVFDKQVTIVPRMIVHKQLERWRLSFYFGDDDRAIGDMEGKGNLPEGFVWRGMPGMSNRGDGVYGIQIEVWDKAGNRSVAKKSVEMMRDPPQVDVALSHSEKEIVADLEYAGKVPLSYWRLEMWTEEGKLLSHVEGEKMPATIDVKLPEMSAGKTISGMLFTRNALGKERRQKVSHFLPDLATQAKQKAEKASEENSWVDEF